MEIDKPAINKASLRIHSNNLTAEQISDALNMQPDGFNVKGVKRVPDHPKSFVHPSHMWRLESDADGTESLDRHISRLIDFVESREDKFKNLQPDCEFDIFCGYFPNGWTGRLELPSQLLKRLAIIPMKILIELYEPILKDEI